MKKNSGLALLFPAVAVFAVAAALCLTCSIHPVQVQVQVQVQAASDPIAVIVNSANPVDNLTLSDLKKLFLSDRSRWDTGKAVAPVILTAGAPERTAFLRIVCNMNDGSFSNYFVQAAFSGKSVTPPKEVSSAAALKSFVAVSPGAIGFVKAGDFHGDNSDGAIRTVKIDGAATADAAYKIRM